MNTACEECGRNDQREHRRGCATGRIERLEAEVQELRLSLIKAFGLINKLSQLAKRP